MEVRRRLYALLILLTPAPGLCQPQDVKSLAGLDLLKLREIPVVSAARHEQNAQHSPRAVSVITAEEIRRRNFRTVPEAIAGLTGVFLQQTNYAGGSPIIRGMVGNRVLILLNGIRLNNGTYRLGPNQYLNFIDINQVERIEVVRGAGSVLYGSDAFGGVINVITRSAPDPLMGAEFGGRVRTRFASSERSGGGRLEFSGAAGRIGLAGGYSQDGFGDLHAGAGPQSHTGYGQYGGDAQVRVALGPGRWFSAGVTRLRQFHAPRTDVLRAGADLEHQWSPEGRDLIYTQFNQTNISRHLDAMQVTVSWQRPVEQLYRVLASDPGVERQHLDAVHTHSVSAQFSYIPRPSHVLTYGFEFASDRAVSRRTDLELATGLRRPAKGNYPDGSRFSSAALFIQDEAEITRRVHAVLGLRHDWFRLGADTSDAVTGDFNIDTRSAALTGSGYVLIDLAPSLAAVFGVSQGFRAPNLDDSTVLGGSGNRFEVPNPDLEPERGVSQEYGLRVKSKRGSGSIVFFHDGYRGLIGRAPGLFNGLPFIDSNRNGLKDANELDVYRRENVGRASVSGVEAESIIPFGSKWTWTHTTTWTRGTDRSLDAPLSRIPPLNAVSRITCAPSPAFWFELAALAAAPQRRLSPGDITDIRIGPGGTAGFAVFHFRTALIRTRLAGLSLSWENFTNRRYRLHGSGFERPGSGLVVAYERSF
jgi:outer membrane receptor protein involved in Fe transport